MKTVMKLQTIFLKNKIKKIGALTLTLFVLAFTFPPVEVQAAPIDSQELTSESAVLIDAESGQVLWEKDKDVQAYSISSAKIITALLALEKLGYDDTVTIDGNSAYVTGNNISLRVGEEVKVKDLIYATLLESANDAATALAFEVSDSLDDFIQMMNEKALDLGAENTQFLNVTGVTYGSDFTTAYDTALIASQALENEDFAEIVGAADHQIPETNLSGERDLINDNLLLAEDSDYKYDGINGIFWGYTSQAGPALVGSAEKDGLSLIVSISHTDENSAYLDAKTLLDYGFENFEKKVLLEKDSFTDETQIQGEKGEKTLKARATADISGTVLKDGSDIEIKTEYKEDLQVPIEEGTLVGTVTVFAGDQELGTVSLEAASDVKDFKIGLPQGFGDNAKKILYGLGALVLIVILFLVIRKIFKNYRRRKNGIFGGNPRRQHEVKRFRNIK